MSLKTSEAELYIEDALLMREFKKEIKGCNISVIVGNSVTVGEAKLRAIARLVRRIQEEANKGI